MNQIPEDFSIGTVVRPKILLWQKYAVWGVDWFGVGPLFDFCDEGDELLVSVGEDLLFIRILDPHYCTMERMKSSGTGI